MSTPGRYQLGRSSLVLIGSQLFLLYPLVNFVNNFTLAFQAVIIILITLFAAFARGYLDRIYPPIQPRIRSPLAQTFAAVLLFGYIMLVYYVFIPQRTPNSGLAPSTDPLNSLIVLAGSAGMENTLFHYLLLTVVTAALARLSGSNGIALAAAILLSSLFAYDIHGIVYLDDPAALGFVGWSFAGMGVVYAATGNLASVAVPHIWWNIARILFMIVGFSVLGITA